jgi:NADPH:quinone reductase-like Zn-dependent oxidoreductase
MKAMRLADSAQTPALIEQDIPQPRPRQGEVLVRVYAAGVTPTELVWYPTSHAKKGITAPASCHHMSSLVRLQKSEAALWDSPSARRSTA